MAVTIWMAPDTHMVAIDEDLIVLNVAEDKYSGLFEAAALISVHPSGTLSVDDETIADELVNAGLATRCPIQRTFYPITKASCALPPSHGSRASDVARAAAVFVTATLAFRRHSFADLLRQGQTAGSPTEAWDEARVASLLAAARIARPWIPGEGQCLQRSFLLRSFLAHQGVATQWVFGVRTWPFAAHCWLQSGATVIGDRFERVTRFTPIMSA